MTDKKADIWSLGIVLLNMEMGLGKPPILASKDGVFNLTQYNKLMQKIQKSRSISAECKEVLLACLAFDPKNRPTAQDLLNFEYFSPPDMETMGIMELSVAHARAFKMLAEAEQALEGVNRHTPRTVEANLRQDIDELQHKIKALQSRIDALSSNPMFGRRLMPRWRR